MILEQIVSFKKDEISRKKNELLQIKKKVSRSSKKGHDFLAALKEPGLSIIAEFKRRSPSARIIAENRDPGLQSQLYQQGGAEAVSVLTDVEFFGGTDQDIISVKKSVSIPVLRKDFIIDELQIYHSLFLGADAVLLIVRILEFDRLKDFISLTKKLGMDALVEVHDLNELETALKAGAEIIGINNRNLDTFNISTETSFKLKNNVPDSVLSVSESGVTKRGQVEQIEKYGFNGVLIGTSLMRSSDPKQFIKNLVRSIHRLRFKNLLGCHPF